MDTPDLPDDMADWPDDPFALLGVGRGASDTDLKRAYNRLVRRFKPEHHPDQFRRIREAYEFCLERAAWFRPEPASPPPPPPPPPARRPPAAEREPVIDPAVSPAPDLEPVVDAGVEPAPPLDPVEELWEHAVTGREAEAYSGLVRLRDERPGDVTVPLRLYWLLNLNPVLDPARTRHHWLADALVRSRLRGPAAELYRRELEADPAGALHDPLDPGPYAAALAVDVAPADALAVARWRVAAAGRLKWYTRILEDLTRLRDTLPTANESGWLELLALAAGWTAWADHPGLANFLKDEVRAVSHLQLSHAPLFDRVEESEVVGRGGYWGRYGGTLSAFLHLVRVSWGDRGYARPAEVEAAAADVGVEPAAALARLDHPFFERPPLLALAAREFEHYLRTRGLYATPDIHPDRLRGLARQLADRRMGSYTRLRPQLLDLLHEHAVHPLEFGAALSRDPEPALRQIALDLRGDLPLQVAWLAGRVLAG